MQDKYDHREVEDKLINLWRKNKYFSPEIDYKKSTFSIFLTPPNASGEMHIGNMLALAIQDILARHRKIKGIPTFWIPSTDHGGYETEVSFERKIESEGKDKFQYSKKELFKEIEKFVSENNILIKKQIESFGSSVDWSRFRYTMDKEGIKSTINTFKKMVGDGIIYKSPYMVHYCPECKTVLSDIELKKREEKQPLYFIKFPLLDEGGYLSLATAHPEFIFASTHLLINKENEQYARYIGKNLMNPLTNEHISIIESKRKYDIKNLKPYLTFFSPSFNKYDYEYALRYNLPTENLFDWDGKMLGKHLGLRPYEAREKEVEFLKKNNSIEKIDDSNVETSFFCKRNHRVESLIALTWFLKLDDEKNHLKKRAMDNIQKDGLSIFPFWKKKIITDWLMKMGDWPIARQNTWGIRIPVWYDISDPSKFLVWFIDKTGKKQQGNLKYFLDKEFTLEEISSNLERIYTNEINLWTLEKESGKEYLPETDLFDTWFSSGQWATTVFGDQNSKEFNYLYPSHSIVIGNDLIRLSVTRKILLSSYLTNKLPFRYVYLHPLIKGSDGQKMSKSLGNNVSIKYYLEKFGADITRMGLIFYTSNKEDFVFEESGLSFYKLFSERLWKIGRIAETVRKYSIRVRDLEDGDKKLLASLNNLSNILNLLIDKFSFSDAQEKTCDFLVDLEKYGYSIKNRTDFETSSYVFLQVLKKYLVILHPFMPFLTEELHIQLFNASLFENNS